jgi:uncharacterized phage-associated protein
MACTCHPASQKANIGRMAVQDQQGKKLCETLLDRKTWAWWYLPVIPALMRRIKIGGSRAKSKTLSQK